VHASGMRKGNQRQSIGALHTVITPRDHLQDAPTRAGLQRVMDAYQCACERRTFKPQPTPLLLPQGTTASGCSCRSSCHHVQQPPHLVAKRTLGSRGRRPTSACTSRHSRTQHGRMRSKSTAESLRRHHCKPARTYQCVAVALVHTPALRFCELDKNDGAHLERALCSLVKITFERGAEFEAAHQAE
jgi:hypothetical protein